MIIPVPLAFGGTALIDPSHFTPPVVPVVAPTIVVVPPARPTFTQPLGPGQLLAFSPGFGGRYAVNGVVLDSQPVTCTAPINSDVLYAGTSFSLGFNPASSMVQSLFITGAQFTFQFQMNNGAIRSAFVLISEANLVGSQLFVTSILLQNSTR